MSDASVDGAVDALRDAPADAARDAPVDAMRDAAPVDATHDAPQDAHPDASPDAPPDAPNDAPFTVDSTDLDLGAADIGQNLVAYITITNTSTMPISVSATITGDIAIYTINSCYVQPQKTCMLAIQYLPYAEGLHAADVALSALSGSPVHVHAHGETYTALTVSHWGPGAITASSASVTCSSTGCSGRFIETVTLTAAPNSGSVFVSWSDASCGTNPSCTVPAEALGRVITAYFAPFSTLQVTASFAGTGHGAVAVTDTFTTDLIAACSASCQVPVPIGHSVEVTTSSLSTVAGISGACTGARTCTFTPGLNPTIVVTFNQDAKEKWSRALETTSAIGVVYDSHGDVIVSTDAFDTSQAKLFKLDGATGKTIWAHPSVPGGEVRIGAMDWAYVLNNPSDNGNLVEVIDANGYFLGVESFYNIGTATSSPRRHFPQRMAEAPDGNVFVESGEASSLTCAESHGAGATYCTTAGYSIESLHVTDSTVYFPVIDSTGACDLAMVDRTMGAQQTLASFSDVPTDQIAVMPSGDVVSAGGSTTTASLRWWMSNAIAFTRDVSIVDAVAGVVALASGNVFWTYSSGTQGYTAEIVDSTGTVSWSLQRPAYSIYGQDVYQLATDGTNVAIVGIDTAVIAEGGGAGSAVTFGAGFIATFQP